MPVAPIAAPATPATASQPASTRLASLDVYRGLTVAGMILVDNPGNPHWVYRQLDHAPWNGVTATDMIFPSFLFIVGLALTLATRARIARGDSRGQLSRRALRRAAVLFLLGLAFNSFYGFHWHTLRLFGILQRIALCYLAACLLYLPLLRSRHRSAILAVSAGALLAGYWALLKLVPVPGIGAGHLDSYGALPAYLDRTLFGVNHLWAAGITPGRGVTYDPEGLLSTLSAIASTLLGVLAGEWLATRASGPRKAVLLAAAGAVLLLSGWALSPAMPLNKRLWTPTFTLFAGGVSLLLFAACYALVDLRRSRSWTPPALVFGTNAIFAFILSGFLGTLADRIHCATPAGSLSLRLSADRLLAAWLDPANASLAFALLMVLGNLLLLYPLYRRRIFLRL